MAPTSVGFRYLYLWLSLATALSATAPGSAAEYQQIADLHLHTQDLNLPKKLGPLHWVGSEYNKHDTNEEFGVIASLYMADNENSNGLVSIGMVFPLQRGSGPDALETELNASRSELKAHCEKRKRLAQKHAESWIGDCSDPDGFTLNYRFKSPRFEQRIEVLASGEVIVEDGHPGHFVFSARTTEDDSSLINAFPGIRDDFAKIGRRVIRTIGHALVRSQDHEACYGTNGHPRANLKIINDSPFPLNLNYHANPEEKVRPGEARIYRHVLQVGVNRIEVYIDNGETSPTSVTWSREINNEGEKTCRRIIPCTITKQSFEVESQREQDICGPRVAPEYIQDGSYREDSEHGHKPSPARQAEVNKIVSSQEVPERNPDGSDQDNSEQGYNPSPARQTEFHKIISSQ